MNKSSIFTLVLVVLSTLFCFVKCQKEKTYLNIALESKEPSTIQTFIRGKWRVRYASGGICSNCQFDRSNLNEYYTFGPRRKILHTVDHKVKMDTIYQWLTDPSSNSDQVHHVMGFIGEGIRSPLFEPVQIKDDTLVLAQPFVGNPDFMLLYLTKER